LLVTSIARNASDQRGQIMSTSTVTCRQCKQPRHLDETFFDPFPYRRCLLCLEQDRITVEADLLVEQMDRAIESLGLGR
jgi:hypothetical protein